MTARPQCARWFGPDNYCDTPVEEYGDYCPVHDPDQSGPDEDFARDGLLEESARLAARCPTHPTR